MYSKKGGWAHRRTVPRELNAGLDVHRTAGGLREGDLEERAGIECDMRIFGDLQQSHQDKHRHINKKRCELEVNG